MITITWKNGYGQVQSYKDPEHGWKLPTQAAGEAAAKRLIKQGAIQVNVMQGEGATSTLLCSFERSEEGKAVRRRS